MRVYDDHGGNFVEPFKPLRQGLLSAMLVAAIVTLDAVEGELDEAVREGCWCWILWRNDGEQKIEVAVKGCGRRVEALASAARASSSLEVTLE